MKNWVIWVIILLIVIGVIVGIFYFKSSSDSSTNEKSSGSISFENSTDLGQEVGKNTDANIFDNLKLNPFENE